MEELAKVKPSRGSYYVVHTSSDGGEVTVTEFKNKRDMYAGLKDISEAFIEAIFKGRKLDMTTKRVYQID